MKALVTGATGFAGRFLLDFLKSKGYEVTGTFHSRKPQKASLGFIKYRHLDLNSEENSISNLIKEECPDEIYHLAAVAATHEDDYSNYYNTNFLGTLNFYEAIRKSGLSPKILYVSSANIYGNVPVSNQPIVESENPLPLNHYAVSKAACDLLSYKYFCEGMHIVRARPFNHTGAGQSDKFVCPRIAFQVIDLIKGNSKQIYIGNLHTKRDFTDVRDVVRAYWLLLQKGTPGEAYNVCSGKVYSIQEVIDILANLAQIDLPITESSYFVRDIDIPLLQGDNKKITKETGWKPDYNIKETLKFLLDYVFKMSRGRSETTEKSIFLG